MTSAITTTYRGWKFRSRTEARWAVAFNEYEIDFEYEYEGFELPSGRYLPDFWLPQVGMFAEVKGREFTVNELMLAADLAEHSDHPVLLLEGTPELAAYWAINPLKQWEYVLSTLPPDMADNNCGLTKLPSGRSVYATDYVPFSVSAYHLSEGRFFSGSGASFSDGFPRPSPLSEEEVDTGPIKAARSARFEHEDRERMADV